MIKNNLEFGQKNISGNSVAVLIITPQGIPLIRDPKKPPPIFWKAPGGRGLPGETAEAGALREIKEEVGITLLLKDLSVVKKEDRESHVLTFFLAKLKSLPKLRTIGDEGEEIKVFFPKEIIALQDFFPNHRKAYEGILKTL